jgi:hypothetical protein
LDLRLGYEYQKNEIEIFNLHSNRIQTRGSKMSERAVLNELVKQIKFQNEILEKISSELETINTNLPDYGTQLDEIENHLGNMGGYLEIIGKALSRRK